MGKIAFAVRIDEEVAQKWRVYASIAGVKHGELIEEYLKQIMQQHPLKGEEKELYEKLYAQKTKKRQERERGGGEV